MINRFYTKLTVGLLSILCLFFLIPSLSADAVKTELITERDKIVTITSQSNLYLEASYNAFSSDLTALGGLAYVNEVISDVLAEQNVVDDLTAELILLQNQLVTKLVHASVNYEFQLARNSNLSAYTLRSQTVFQNELDRIEIILNNPRSGDEIISALTADIEAAFDLLILLADKTELNQKMAEATATSLSDGTLYTPNSFTLFINSYHLFDITILPNTGMTTREIYNNADASVDEALSAVEAINNAVALLILRPDKTDLINAYNLALEYDLSSFTPNSVDAYNNGLDIIESVINNPNALQADLDQAITDLINLYDILIEKADTSLLSELNTEALVAYYEEKLKYTEDSHNLFQSAVNNYGTYAYINSVILDLNVTQETIDQLTLTVQNAISLLVERGNIAPLQTKYLSLLEIDLSPFTPNSIAEFQTGLNTIYQIINSPNTDQSLVNQTMTDIESLESILVYIAETTTLNSLIKSVDSIVSTDYTATSYGYLQSVLHKANNAITDLNTSQDDIDIIKTELEEAISSLRTKLSPVIINAHRGNIDLKEYVVIGDSSILSFYSHNESVALVSEDGYLSGIDFGNTIITVTLANGLTEDIPIIVKAKIATSSFVLVLSLPFVSIGLAFVLLSSNGLSKFSIKKIRNTKEI